MATEVATRTLLTCTAAEWPSVWPTGLPRPCGWWPLHWPRELTNGCWVATAMAAVATRAVRMWPHVLTGQLPAVAAPPVPA
jgi:hypothetical protein